MRVIDVKSDLRSGCKSVLVAMTLNEYKNIAYKAFEMNGNMDGQRGVIKRSSAAIKIRKRMQFDFNEGAVFPQVVLGVLNFNKKLITGSELKTTDFDIDTISIIDGMQRSNIYFTNFLGNEEREVRVEFWIADESIKLLYRMLVLNTGQMPWNTRRQVEVIFSNLSKSIIEKLLSKYNDLSGNIEIYSIDDGKKRNVAGRYHKSEIIEAYLAFNTRNVKVQVSDELADEFQRFDMMETIEKPKSFEYFVDSLAMMFKLDLAFQKFTPIYEEKYLFKSGKDVFGSSTACIGFMVACAEFIMGKISVERDSEIQEQKCVELVNKINKMVRKIDEIIMNNGVEFDYLSLDSLNRICEKLPKSRIGDEQRRLFKNAFNSMIRYDEFEEIPNLEDFWRE